MRIRRPSLAGGALIALGLALVAPSPFPAGAASSAIVGTASTFGVLAASAVTNTGPTVITGDVGVSPDAAVSGFPPGTYGGTLHAADAVAAQAQSDATTGYNDLAGRASTAAVPGDLDGLVLTPGVYTADSSLLLTNTVTLDANGDPDALFIFQVGSTLTTATGSVVALVDGASACNVYWQIGSSATLGTGTDFAGTIVALASISANTGATVEGQLLARTGAVTLDDNVIDSSTCTSGVTGTPGATTTTTASTTPGSSATASTTPTLTSGASTTGEGDVAATTTTAPGGPGTTVVGGGSSTGTPAPAPRLPETGDGTTVPAIAAVLLVLGGTLLVWFGRPALLHSTRRRRA